MAEELRKEIATIAKEPPNPLDPAQALPTSIMFGIAMLGGFVAFYTKWRQGAARPFNFTELIGEMFVSGICGMFALWLLKGAGVNEYFVAFGVGLAGHAGPRSLFLFEQVVKRWVEKTWGIDSREGEQRREADR